MKVDIKIVLTLDDVAYPALGYFAIDEALDRGTIQDAILDAVNDDDRGKLTIVSAISTVEP